MRKRILFPDMHRVINLDEKLIEATEDFLLKPIVINSLKKLKKYEKNLNMHLVKLIQFYLGYDNKTMKDVFGYKKKDKYPCRKYIGSLDFSDIIKDIAIFDDIIESPLGSHNSLSVEMYTRLVILILIDLIDRLDIICYHIKMDFPDNGVDTDIFKNISKMCLLFPYMPKSRLNSSYACVEYGRELMKLFRNIGLMHKDRTKLINKRYQELNMFQFPDEITYTEIFLMTYSFITGIRRTPDQFIHFCEGMDGDYEFTDEVEILGSVIRKRYRKVKRENKIFYLFYLAYIGNTKLHKEYDKNKTMGEAALIFFAWFVSEDNQADAITRIIIDILNRTL